MMLSLTSLETFQSSLLGNNDTSQPSNYMPISMLTVGHNHSRALFCAGSKLAEWRIACENFNA
eukprot:7534181-Pyramimonas_sp.AAC.1